MFVCVLCCSVPEFEASQYLVTNGEFLEFVESGGYQNKDLWTLEGMECETSSDGLHEGLQTAHGCDMQTI